MPCAVPPFSWSLPVQVRFGDGCADELPAALQGRPALVMAFPGAVASALRATWERALGEQLLAWLEVSDGLSSLARARTLAATAWPLLAAHPDAVLIAVGGGTTLDLAKMVRCRPADPTQPIGEASGPSDSGVTAAAFDAVAGAIRGDSPWPALALAPLWAVPTTAGTGSEVTRWATVWDTDAKPAVKRSLDEAWGYPQRAWVDPTLTRTCPVGITRDTALDTLAHALEALWNRHANPISSALAMAAARRVLTSLPARLARPDEAEPRRALSLAALEAGLAFSQTRTALAHALSYALTLEQGVPHGAACAVWLPSVWRLAVGRDPGLDLALAELSTLLQRQEWALDARAGRQGAATHSDDAVRPENAKPPHDPQDLQDLQGADPQLAGQALEGAAALTRWLRRLGAAADPREVGVDDGVRRLHAALDSARGRNFVVPPG